MELLADVAEELDEVLGQLRGHSRYLDSKTRDVCRSRTAGTVRRPAVYISIVSQPPKVDEPWTTFGPLPPKIRIA